MIRNYAHELEKEYMPYAVFDRTGENIIGFTANIPKSAKIAAKKHIEMSMKFDDVSNSDYWIALLKKLDLG